MLWNNNFIGIDCLVKKKKKQTFQVFRLQLLRRCTTDSHSDAVGNIYGIE